MNGETIYNQLRIMGLIGANDAVRKRLIIEEIDKMLNEIPKVNNLDKADVSNSYKIKSGKYCSDCGKELQFIDNRYDGYSVFGNKTKRLCLTCSCDDDLL